jgi:hypothetical protein
MVCVMTIDAHILTLTDVAHVQGGFPFRGPIQESVDGAALAVQMKDLDPQKGINWNTVARTVLIGRKQPDRLRWGDLLLVAKGARFYAVYVDDPPDLAVCSPHLFHLRIRLPQRIDPHFLVWQINQPPFQRRLQQAAEGTSQLSIRRPVLESLEISVPTLAKQRHVVALIDMAHKERRILEELIRNRELQLHALAESLTQAATQRTL